MYTIDKFFHSTFWFGLGLLLNRTKYILLTIIIFHLGLINVAIFYISIYFVSSIASFVHRLVSSNYNRFLRDRAFLAEAKNLHATLNSSLALSLSLGVGASFITFFLSWPIAALFKEPQLVKTIQLLSLTIPFLIMSRQITQILSMLARYREAVIFHNIIDTTLTLVVAYASIVLFTSNLYTALLWQVLVTILSALIGIVLLHKIVPTFRLDFTRIHIPVKLTKTIVINASFALLFSQGDIFIVGFYFDLLTVGSYIGLLVIPRLLYAIATSVFGMFLPTAASFSKEKEKMAFFSKKVFRYMLIVSFPLLLLVLLYPKETGAIIHVHAIDQTTLQLFALAYFLRSWGWLGGQVLIASKTAYTNMKINAFLTIFVIFSEIVIRLRFGFKGIGWVFVLADFLDASFKVYVCY